MHRYHPSILIFIILSSFYLQAQNSEQFPSATWLQDVHFPGTVYAGIGAPVMADVQAHFGTSGEIMFYLNSDVDLARPLIADIHAQGKKYWVNLDAYHLEGIDVQAIIDDGQGITDPDFGASVTLEGNLSGGRSINRQEWRNFLINCIKRAIDAGADGSQHDGATPPFGSFDDEDVAAFKQYVSDRSISTGDWDPDAMTFREYLLSKGKTDDNVFDTENDPQNVKDLIGYWFDFKAVQTLKSWQELKQACSDYARSKGKEYTLALNAASSFGTHDGHVYWAADYYIGEFFSWGNYYPLTGTVAARARLAQAFGKRFICWSSPTLDDISSEPNVSYGIDIESQAEMALASQLYASGGLPQLKYPAERTYPVFYLAQTQSDLLNSVSPAASMGVVMSQAQTIQDQRGLEGLITVLQDINRSFEVVWFQSNLLDLPDEVVLSDLQKYDVLFLPEVFYLTDNQRTLLLSYMEAGGTVIAVRGNVEYCGYYDEHGNVQSNATWESLVNHNSSGIFSYGSGRFINIAHHIKEPSGYPPSMYGLAYIIYKADPSMDYLAKSIRDTVEKWVDVAIPTREVEAAAMPGYVRFFRYQDVGRHQYIYQVTADSVNLASRQPVAVGPIDVELAVDAASSAQQFDATWYSISQPEGVPIGTGLTVDAATGRLAVQIPQFTRWGFVHLDGSRNSSASPVIGNLTINGHREFRRLKSGSSVQAAWQVISGNPGQYQIEVWTSLNGSGDPVVTNQLSALNPSKIEQMNLFKGATRVMSETVSSAANDYLIPAGALHDSLVYLFRVRAIENSDTSSWLKQFFYRNARPGHPRESMIYTASQDLWYYTDGAMAPVDTSRRVIFAYNKAPYYGGDFELDSLEFGVYVYTDSLARKSGDTTRASHLIGSWFDHKLAWNQSMPDAHGDLQDTVRFSLEPYENFGIYFRTVATDGIDTSALSPWFGFYLDNRNDPPAPFHLVEPADNSFTDKQIPFKWTSDGDPDPINLENRNIRMVEIFFDSVASFDSPGLHTYAKDRTGSQFEQDTISLDLPPNYFQATGLLNYDRVYWKVRMWDYDRHSADGSNSLSRDSEEIFVLNMGSGAVNLAAPLLQQPADRARDLPLRLNLQWQPVNGADSYTVQVARDINFQNIVFNIPGHKSTMLAVDKLQSNTTYYWRVKAQNQSGPGQWSAVWTFSTLPLPAAVNLLSPQNGGVISATSVTFHWQPSGPAVKGYKFQYADNASFTNAIVNPSLPDTSYTLHELEANKKYWWRVRAENEAGWGPWSAAREFTIVLTDIFDEQNLLTDFALAQNFPNPFNPSTRIFFILPETEYVEITLFNISGQRLKTLYAKRTPAGIHGITVHMDNLPSGVYFYQMTAGSFRQVKKMQLLH